MKINTISEDLITSVIFEVEDEEKALDMNNKVILDTYDKEFDGIFPTKASWTRFCNSVDKEGAYYLAKKMSFKSKGKSILADDDKIIVVYKEPILVNTGFYLKNGIKKYITSKVNKITFQLDYEFLWTSSDNNMPSSVDIWGNIIAIA